MSDIPQNLNVVARANYNVLWWDAANGATGYNVYKSVMLNESNTVLAKVITTTDAQGVIDTAYLDTALDEVAVYRVASSDGSMVESDVSERAIAIKTNSMINAKEESVDRKLFELGTSRLGEDILA